MRLATHSVVGSVVTRTAVVNTMCLVNAGNSNSSGVVYEATIYLGDGSSDILVDTLSTGVLTFNSAPDYETKSSYTATVTASDGTNSATQNITVNVTNVE